MMHTLRVIVAILGLFLVPAMVPAQQAKDTATTPSQKMDQTTTGTQTAKLNDKDHRFLLGAASGGMAEVELGRLAEQRASRADVKQFGQRMVTDHSKANEQLLALAKTKGVTVPQKMQPKHQREVDRLTAMTTRTLDRPYMRIMVRDHQQDVKEFQEQSENGTDPELKAFAAQTLPVLREHLKMAQDISKQLKPSAQKKKGKAAE